MKKRVIIIAIVVAIGTVAFLFYRYHLWRRELAQLNFRAAMCYFSGQGVEKNEAEAVRLLRKAADHGHAEAQCALAIFYDEGMGGITQNRVEAVRWFRKAAAQGHAHAQYNLGVRYAVGKGGVTKNHAEAVKWLRKSAVQGQEEAKEILNNMGETW